jgi:hypothetical protein
MKVGLFAPKNPNVADSTLEPLNITFLYLLTLVDQKYILAKWPINYALYKHVRDTAAGKAYRHDHYLYGHPSGRRFRSANQFGPHLLWLMNGSEEADCPCEICSVDDRKTDKKAPGERGRKSRVGGPSKESPAGGKGSKP